MTDAHTSTCTCFSRKGELFVSKALLSFIESEVLATSDVSSDAFFDALSVLVAEVGGRYRHLDIMNEHRALTLQEQQALFEPCLQVTPLIYLMHAESPDIRDEHRCAIPVGIAHILIKVIQAKGRKLNFVSQSKAQAELLFDTYSRAQALLPDLKAVVEPASTSNVMNLAYA